MFSSGILVNPAVLPDAFSQSITQIQGIKWNDQNADGIRNSGESGVSGIEICAFDVNFNEGAVPEGEFLIPENAQACAVTDSFGFYSLVLYDSYWYVHEFSPSGFAQTFPPVDNPHIFNLSDGETRTDIDFGNVLGGILRGVKWNDQNENGIRDAGEEGIPFVYIYLNKLTPPDTEGLFVQDTETIEFDPVFETGTYEFTVPPGFYKIQEDSGGTQTFPPNGAPHYVSVTGGDVIENLDFGNSNVPGGTIIGLKFNDLDFDGGHTPDEPGTPGITFCLSPIGICTSSNELGEYQFTNVPPGTYGLSEILPIDEYIHQNEILLALPTTPITQTVTVTPGGITIAAPFGNRVHVPPPDEVTVASKGWLESINGVPYHSPKAPITIEKIVGPEGFDHCGADKPIGIKLVITSGEQKIMQTDMFEVNPLLELWQGTTISYNDAPGIGFSPIGVRSVGDITFYVDCPPDTPNYPGEYPDDVIDNFGPEDEIQNGGNLIFIDPSGIITDACTDDPIEDATVTLFVESPPTTGNFIVPPIAYHLPSNNPIQTDVNGHYAWDVIAGNYKIIVEKPGYVSQESIVVTIPPEVTDLDLILDRIDACPVLLPDLTVSSLSILPNSPVSGDFVNVNVDVTNIGSSSTSASFRVDLFDNAVLVGSRTVPAGLVAGSTIPISPSFSITLDAGDHTLTVEVDVLDTETESDETNNDSSISFNVPAPDTDGDGIPDDLDVCPIGDDNADEDSDGIPDACDFIPVATVTSNVIEGEIPFDVAFTCESTTGNEPLTYSWDFGDGTPHINDPIITHTYSDEDTFTATCTVTDSDNDSDSSSIDITAINQSLQDQKLEQIGILQSISDQSKQTQKEIDKSINEIGKSLDDKFWQDEETLDPKKGHKVFDHEKKAVKSLMKTLDDKKKKHSASDDAKPIIQGVVDSLASIDRQLAFDAFDEANTPDNRDDKKSRKELDKSESELAKGDEEVNKGKLDKAIDHYKKAWKHAQKAMKHEITHEDDDDDEHDDKDGKDSKDNKSKKNKED